MSASDTCARTVPEPGIISLPWTINRRKRPSFRISDLWKAPLHDFPIRDEIIYQCLALPPEASVLEIGPGSGFTAFRMSREVREATLVDFSAQAIEQLREDLKALKNLSFISADICSSDLPERLGRMYDVAFGLAVFDVVPEPAACLKNLRAILRPGGQLLLQFPNYPPPKGRGRTWLTDRHEIDQMLSAAGFENWGIFALHLRPGAEFVFQYLHEMPIALLRRLRRSTREDPTKYETTWAFQRRSTLESLRFFIHAVWAALLGLLHAQGECFELRPLGEEILNHNLLIVARRSDTP